MVSTGGHCFLPTDSGQSKLPGTDTFRKRNFNLHDMHQRAPCQSEIYLNQISFQNRTASLSEKQTIFYAIEFTHFFFSLINLVSVKNIHIYSDLSAKHHLKTEKPLNLSISSNFKIAYLQHKSHMQ